MYFTSFLTLLVACVFLMTAKIYFLLTPKIVMIMCEQDKRYAKTFSAKPSYRLIVGVAGHIKSNNINLA